MVADTGRNLGLLSQGASRWGTWSLEHPDPTTKVELREDAQYANTYVCSLHQLRRVGVESEVPFKSSVR